jgi:CRISPR/Cas system CSM-associated protein Csm4 (group 5 of RAMP superfamily)
MSLNRIVGEHTTILDKNLETIPANITKLLNIDKTNFGFPPPPQFNVLKGNAETTFGNIP